MSPLAASQHFLWVTFGGHWACGLHDNHILQARKTWDLWEQVPCLQARLLGNPKYTFLYWPVYWSLSLSSERAESLAAEKISPEFDVLVIFNFISERTQTERTGKHKAGCSPCNPRSFETDRTVGYSLTNKLVNICKL